MGFLSQWDGTDIIDLGNGYNVTMKRFLPGDTEDRAKAARVVAVTEASRDKNDKTVRVETRTNEAAYNEIILMDAIVAWNLTDRYDQLLPLEPEAKKLESIRLLPGPVRQKLLDKIEENRTADERSTEDQKNFRQSGDVSPAIG